MKRHSRYFYCFLVAMTFWVQFAFSQTYTRGIGIYPGRVQEAYVPTLVQNNTYRNIALHRKAYHSSSYDYNLTAQLITDGIITRAMPPRLTVTTNQGILPLREREWAIDRGEYTRNILLGSKAFIQYQWDNMHVTANEISIVARVAYHEQQATSGYKIRLLACDERGKWQVVAQQAADSLPGVASRYKAHSDPNKVTHTELLPTRNLKMAFRLNGKVPHLYGLRLELQMSGAAHWTLTQLNFAQNGIPVTDVLPSAAFRSAWMSATSSDEWVKVDLGAQASFDKIKLHWLNKAIRGEVLVSKDDEHWERIATLQQRVQRQETIACKATARYVKVKMTASKNGKPFVLSEIEVMGRGGLTAKPYPESTYQDNRWSLNGGNWRLQRASEVHAVGEQIASLKFDDSSWITATVPATVLSSYVNIGAVPHPNRDNQLFMASESFFNSNFWYRRTFILPKEMVGQAVFLNFDGINWKANIYLNGKRINRIEGAFIRSKTEITHLLREGKNVLAVEIIKTQHPGAVKEKNQLNTDFNGGILGADNPTFHATIGWDWISTVRGRNIGIWNHVYLTAERCVTLSDAVVTTRLHLPDTLATVTPSVRLTNNQQHPIHGVLKGWIGAVKFEKPVIIPASTTIETSFLPTDYAQLQRQRFRLWWPNGYGEPYLYDAGYIFEAHDGDSQPLHYKAGIRQMSYKDAATRLTLYINGKRFIPLGGNWGFSESNLNYRAREYDAAVKYHRNMNCNMIRNWVGQTGNDEFYEACDRYGIMVWKDFWLANPSDGPDPQDERMFLNNAKDDVYRIRNHPCIALYCGRNEGFPPKTLDTALRQIVNTMHPDMLYISSSADEGVSGHGPYWALPEKEYFEKQTGKLHTERGMPNVMNYESLCRTLSPHHLWPQNDAWGKHDYTLEGAQRGASFNGIIEKAFGVIGDAHQFTKLAQWVNYNGYRAMFESGSKHRLGLLIWMSHPCWPSMTWQTYDYYLEPTAAYFGVKKACEPLHIQWNASTRKMEVVNLHKMLKDSLTAQCEVLDMWGKSIVKYQQRIETKPDTTVECMAIDAPAIHGTVYYLKMSLLDAQNRVLSDNFYVCSTDEGNFQALHSLPAVKPAVTFVKDKNKVKVKLYNPTDTPAMLIRLQLKGSDGEQILPVDYTDNYFHLMPHERKTVVIAWEEEDARGVDVQLQLEGMNVPTAHIPFVR